MAISTLTEKQFLNGRASASERSYTVLYEVLTNNSQDGIRTVGSHPTFRIGKEYRFGGESDAEATLVDVNRQLVADELEVAILEASNGRRCFQRLEDAAVGAILS